MGRPPQIDAVEITVGHLLAEIGSRIQGSLPVRREAVEARGDYAPPPDYPITPAELRSFVSEFVSDDPFFGDALLTRRESYVVTFPTVHIDALLRSVSTASLHSNWLGADGPHYISIKKHMPAVRARTSRQISTAAPLEEQIEGETRIYAPSLNVLLALFKQRIDLNRLSWRQLEEIIAEMLKVEGYEVELRRGTKDSGAAVIAHRELATIGYVKTIWQAKHLQNGNKVGIGVIRELADVRNEMNATKGIIVTSSYLTRGALARVERDNYNLGKMERPELELWIESTLSGRPQIQTQS